MALYNYDINNLGTWVPINPIRADDGFGNLITNDTDGVVNVFKYMASDK